jgi:protein gp37
VLRHIPAIGRFLLLEPLLEDLGPLDLRGIGGVIVGDESGPTPRPMAREWVRSIRDQCMAASVPFFFKQWGGRDRAKGGDILDGRTWKDRPWYAGRLNQA